MDESDWDGWRVLTEMPSVIVCSWSATTCS